MTVIISLKTEAGILLATDSVELYSGSYILIEDFVDFLISQKIIQTKDEFEQIQDTELKFKINEITKIFEDKSKLTKNVIHYTENHQKIIKLTDNTAIQISGNVQYGTVGIYSIINEIKKEIITKPEISVDDIAEISYQTILKYYNNLSDIDKRKKFKHIISGFDIKDKKLKLFTIYNDEILDCLKDNCSLKGIEIGGKYEKYLKSIVSAFNSDSISSKLEKFNLLNAFDLITSIISMTYDIEKIYNDIYEVGGKIQYALIDSGGVKYIENKSELMDYLNK